MKKFLIASGIAALAFASIAGAQGAQFTSNLTVGSTGAQVVALQTALIAAGFDIPSISAGTAAKGYFGSQTKAAVQKYQAANGVPNTGFVGPLTRAVLNAGGSVVNPGGSVVVCPAGYTCVPAGGTNPGTGTVTTIGAEGQLTSFDLVGSVSSESVDEGESDAKVLGLEMEAEDSDMVIERVDVDFTAPATGSDDLDDYIESVTLWLDSTKLATLDVDRADDDTNDLFSFRFTGLKAVVKEGDTATLYVSVNAVNNVDSGDTYAWSVNIPATGIRAVDGAGISDTYGAANMTETFTVGDATAGELDITKNTSSPRAGIVTVSETNDTSDVTLLIIDLEADESDVTVEAIPVGIAATGGDVDEIVKSVSLVRGSTVLDTKSIPTSASTYYRVVFDDLDLTIDEGDTEALKVVADINDLEGNFEVGDSVYATTTGSDVGWDAEDANNDSITPQGSVTGEAQSFYVDGLVVTKVDATVSDAYSSVEGSGTKSKADYMIVFDVKANGSHAIIDAGVARIGVTGAATPTTATNGLSWSTTTATTVGTTTVSSTLEPVNGLVDDDGSYNYFIEKGTTRRFALKVTLDNQSGTSGSAAVMLRGVRWAATTTADFLDTDNTGTYQLYNFNLGNFVTGSQNLFDN